MWRIFAILFILFPFAVFAECVLVDTTTKCARFPIEDDYLGWGDYVVTDGVALSDNEWRHFRNGIPVYGTASIISSGKSPQVECVVSSPFVTSFVQTYPWGSTITQADAVNGCATLDVFMAWEFPLSEPATALDGDVCPDGFYTVPYEISCGEGMVNISDAPNCDDDTSGEFCLVDMSSTPTSCISTDTVTKCARLPDSLAFHSGSTSDSWVDNDNGLDWSVVYENSIVVSGTTVGDLSDDITCVIYSPFKAETTVLFEPAFMFVDMPAEICSNKEYTTGYVYDSIRELDGDMCPDGFYTVPYDVSCGVGLVEVSDIPQCDTDTSGEFCLIGGAPLAAPCAAGVSTLRTGTGVSIPLWADKNTTPALAVRYNNMTCWGNLQSGQVTNGINVKYNNQVYHLVE